MSLNTKWLPFRQPLDVLRHKRWRSIAILCGALGFSLLFTNQAEASFIGSYSLSNFMLNNSSTCALDMPNGFASTPDAGSTVVLTGSNSGSGCAGTTDLTTTAAAAGTVQFNYLYTANDDPGADFAGYLLGNSYTQFAAQSGLSGNILFQVASGQKFGFRVGTVDNQGEPGVLTISGFSAPIPATGGNVPEPGTLSCAIISLGALLGKKFLNRSARRNREEATA